MLITMWYFLGQAYSSLDLKFMENLVYRTRASTFPNWKALVCSEPFRWCRIDDERSFFRFCNQIVIDNSPLDFLGFSHPDILFELGDYLNTIFLLVTKEMVIYF